MALDLAYVDGDNRLEGGNYAQVSDVSPKIARAIRMHQTRIDGQIVGNPGWERVRGMPATRTALLIWQRSCEETLAPFVDQQMIADLSILVELGEHGAVRTAISYRDLTTGEAAAIMAPSPWGA